MNKNKTSNHRIKITAMRSSIFNDLLNWKKTSISPFINSEEAANALAIFLFPFWHWYFILSLAFFLSFLMWQNKKQYLFGCRRKDVYMFFLYFIHVNRNVWLLCLVVLSCSQSENMIQRFLQSDALSYINLLSMI